MIKNRAKILELTGVCSTTGELMQKYYFTVGNTYMFCGSDGKWIDRDIGWFFTLGTNLGNNKRVITGLFVVGTVKERTYIREWIDRSQYNRRQICHAKLSNKS